MPLSPTATRELLAQLGHQPKRFLGQNFLVDGNIVRKSLELAAVQKDVDGARQLFERMFPVIEFVFEKSGIRAIHTALDIVGRSAGPPRRPVRMLGKEDRAVVERLLRACEDLIRWK